MASWTVAALDAPHPRFRDCQTICIGE